jgi:AraC family transcriptional regulator
VPRCLEEGIYFGSDMRVSDLAGLRITQRSYQPHACLPRHSHAQPYLCLVGAGSFEERVHRRTEACVAGSVVWNPAGATHVDRFGAGGARTWNVEFTHAWEERLAAAAPHWSPACSPEVRWLAAGILRELAEPDTASALVLEGQVCALIGVVSRQSPTIERKRPAWLRSAEDRLRAEFRHPPPLGEMAQAAGVHRSHFARTFRCHFGCTVAQFVRRLRIGWAAEQLLREHCVLAQLAPEAGFADQAHFTRSFKQIMGLTPGEYRAAMR